MAVTMLGERGGNEKEVTVEGEEEGAGGAGPDSERGGGGSCAGRAVEANS